MDKLSSSPYEIPQANERQTEQNQYEPIHQGFKEHMGPKKRKNLGRRVYHGIPLYHYTRHFSENFSRVQLCQLCPAPSLSKSRYSLEILKGLVGLATGDHGETMGRPWRHIIP